MNDSDLKQLFAEAVAHPAPDGVDLDAAVRAGRRRRRFRAGAAVASSGGVLAVVAALALTVVPDLRTDRAAPAASVAPSELVVACSPDGIRVSSTRVTATPAGVVIQVSSTMPAGAHLAYGWSGGGGGDLMPSNPTVWTLTPPPGGLTLSCSLNGDPGPSATAAVTVIDPYGYWRATSVRDLGCASWADTLGGGGTGSGSTERDAVEGLLGQLTDVRTDLRAEPTGIGYLRAVTQTWFVTSAGRPYITVDVRASGSAYLAQPGLWCADQLDGRGSAR